VNFLENIFLYFQAMTHLSPNNPLDKQKANFIKPSLEPSAATVKANLFWHLINNLINKRRRNNVCKTVFQPNNRLRRNDFFVRAVGSESFGGRAADESGENENLRRRAENEFGARRNRTRIFEKFAR
jgi:hypothetical protein